MRDKEAQLTVLLWKPPVKCDKWHDIGLNILIWLRLTTTQTVYCFNWHDKLAIGWYSFLAKLAFCFLVVYTVDKDCFSDNTMLLFLVRILYLIVTLVVLLKSNYGSLWFVTLGFTPRFLQEVKTQFYCSMKKIYKLGKVFQNFWHDLDKIVDGKYYKEKWS